MKAILAAILSPLARLHLWRFRPVVVAVTGSAGKTTTKLAIAAVVGTKLRVSASGGNLNDQLGIPASVIIGNFSGWYAAHYANAGLTPLFWLRVLFLGIVGLLRSRDAYPEVLVFEFGADHPGDIAHLCSLVPPRVGVVTRIGEIPVHVEYYSSARHLAQEKEALVKAIPTYGLVVLNADDLTVLEMRASSQAAVTTYGFGPGARVRVDEFLPDISGIRFNVTDHATMPFRIRGTIGKGAALAAGAAVAVGAHFGIGLAQASEALSRMAAPAGRMRVLSGIKGSIIVDDTYNSSPAALHLALDTVREMKGRKVIVLGDMKELGEHSPKAHQEAGTMAAAIAGVFVCVGDGGRLMAEAASNQMAAENIHWFDDSTLAAPQVQRLIRAGDVILVKGSQSMRMERVVREIMAEPQNASEMLVRQSMRWLAK